MALFFLGWFSTYRLLLIKSCVLCWISVHFIIFITENEIPVTLSCLDKVKSIAWLQQLKASCTEALRECATGIRKTVFCNSHIDESQWKQKQECLKHNRLRQSFLHQLPPLLQLVADCLDEAYSTIFCRELEINWQSGSNAPCLITLAPSRENHIQTQTLFMSSKLLLKNLSRKSP